MDLSSECVALSWQHYCRRHWAWVQLVVVSCHAFSVSWWAVVEPPLLCPPTTINRAALPCLSVMGRNPLTTCIQNKYHLQNSHHYQVKAMQNNEYYTFLSQ